MTGKSSKRPPSASASLQFAWRGLICLLWCRSSENSTWTWDGTILAMRPSKQPGIENDSHRSEMGGWRTAQRPSEPHLSDYVLGYFASEGSLPRPLYERHLPSREVAIILSFAGPHRFIQPERSDTTDHKHAWIVPLQQRHHMREAEGSRDFLVIRLTPMGAHMLLRTPLDRLAGCTAALDTIDPRFSRLLMERAGNTKDWAERFNVVEGILTARLASAPAPPEGLNHTWRMLRSSPNHIDLERLPLEFGCSRRHLIAQFHKYFGMTPKLIARIGRFQLALAAVHRCRREVASPYVEGRPYLDSASAENDCRVPSAQRPWTNLALASGYYDQSHFINEFRAFSGLSPLEFLRRTRDA